MESLNQKPAQQSPVYGGNFETSMVRAEPVDPDKVRREAEKRQREIQKARSQNPSFGY